MAFEAVANDDFALNGAKVRSRWVRHTDPTLGFRVEMEGVSVAYMSDHGPGTVPEDADDYVPATCSTSAMASTSSSTTRSTPPRSTRSSARGVTAPSSTRSTSPRKRARASSRCSTTARRTATRASTPSSRDAREFSARINGPEVFAASDGLRHELRSSNR